MITLSRRKRTTILGFAATAGIVAGQAFAGCPCNSGGGGFSGGGGPSLGYQGGYVESGYGAGYASPYQNQMGQMQMGVPPMMAGHPVAGLQWMYGQQPYGAQYGVPQLGGPPSTGPQSVRPQLGQPPGPPPGNLGQTYRHPLRPIADDKHPRVAVFLIHAPGATEVKVQGMDGYRVKKTDAWRFESDPLLPHVPHIYTVIAEYDRGDRVEKDYRLLRAVMGRIVEYDYDPQPQALPKKKEKET